tara:strand:+ start:362 stop:880 length:519 start_codon:yes stop_codon:yes gene_type:complete
MKNIIFLLFISVFSINTSLAQNKVENPKYEKKLKRLLDHDVNELSVKEVLQLDSLQDIIYLDARERNEYEVSHIDSAIWVGYDTFDVDSLKDLPKDKKIVVYCSVGYRSEKVSEKMLKAGFKDVSNLYGGIFEWVNMDQPVYNQNGETPKVHAYDENWGQWVQKGDKVYNEK